MSLLFDTFGETVELALAGKAVVALASDGDVMRKTGQIMLVGDVAREYGFTDTDGPSLTVNPPMRPTRISPPPFQRRRGSNKLKYLM